jgi:hypothetical protein
MRAWSGLNPPDITNSSRRLSNSRNFVDVFFSMTPALSRQRPPENTTELGIIERSFTGRIAADRQMLFLGADKTRKRRKDPRPPAASDRCS